MTTAEHLRMRISAQDENLQALAREARKWLFEAAAPLWSTAGWDEKGLFAERLSLQGEPDDAPRRVFVQARHIYAFVQIGRLGWTGPWRERTNAALDYLIVNARREDGLFAHRLTPDGRVDDARADLYDQAFIMFCLGHAAFILQRPELVGVAKTLAETLDRLWLRPAGGYYEGEIVDQTVRLQNPHMHLFEAFLALSALTNDPFWNRRALTMAELCQKYFIDRHTGALLEYFDLRFEPLLGERGRIVEPGHCCEWAWLFERLVDQGWRGGESISDGLTDFARRYGIDTARGVMINEVLLDGSVCNGRARLWPQTERLKAALARWRRTGSTGEAIEAKDAYHGLQCYLSDLPAGIWRDKLKEDGSWVEEPAPGSSLYHITCAYAELIDTCDAKSLA